MAKKTNIKTTPKPKVKTRSRAKKKTESARWTSNRLFIFAAAGVAIGLNNFWQFPYLVPEYGGSLFLICYLFFLVVLGYPLLMAQLSIGRLGRASPILSVKSIVDDIDGDPNWHILGSMATFTGFLVLTYLSVIGGWTIAYSFRAVFGSFDGLTADGIGSIFGNFVSDPERQMFWHSLFVVITMIAAARGLKRGIEPLIRCTVIIIFLLILVLLLYVVTLPNFGGSMTSLFTPNWSNFGVKSVLVALGQTFFSLGLGYGVYIVYGAYLPEETNIGKSVAGVIGLDTLAAFAVTIIIFSILQAAGQELASGPILMFKTLPLALDILPFSQLVITMIFIMLALASITTSVALIEPMILWLTETHSMTRFMAAVWSGIGVWLLGIIIIFSFNEWAFKFHYFGTEKQLGIFDAVQIVTSNFLLPLTGIFAALFVGWSINQKLSAEFFGFKNNKLFIVWLWLMRIIIPLLLVVVLFSVPVLFL